MRAFGELEATVMNLIWDKNGADRTVRDVYELIRRDREIAYTTVMSTMDNLHRKGWLSRVREGKAYLYRAIQSREEHGASLMKEALSTSGRTELVLTHFLEHMTDSESKALRHALQEVSGKTPQS